MKRNAKREFSFDVDTTYDIQTLEVHIQQPYRAEGVWNNPRPRPIRTKKMGLTISNTHTKNVKAGSPKNFAVVYSKKDDKPSVDIKYSSMASNTMFDGRTGEILLVVGALALLVIVFSTKEEEKSVSGLTKAAIFSVSFLATFAFMAGKYIFINSAPQNSVIGVSHSLACPCEVFQWCWKIAT